MNEKHNKLQTIYRNNKPYGIRDENGFLFFFAEIQKYPVQEERYKQEILAQFALAEYLEMKLRERRFVLSLDRDSVSD